MASEKELQEIALPKQSKTAVNANAKPAMPMKGVDQVNPKIPIEDLGGPTPENASPTNDSMKLKPPGGTLKQVSDAITNRKGKVSGALAKDLKAGDEVEVTDEQEIVAEDQQLMNNKKLLLKMKQQTQKTLFRKKKLLLMK